MSGWSTKGYKACPTCNADALGVKLRSKIGYIGYRRFLPQNHRLRRSYQYNGKQERQPQPKELSGDDVLQQLTLITEDTPGKYPNNKKRKHRDEELNWKKKYFL